MTVKQKIIHITAVLAKLLELQLKAQVILKLGMLVYNIHQTVHHHTLHLFFPTTRQSEIFDLW